MSIKVRTRSAIEELLRRGLTPITDNYDALVELGFERAYPQVERGWEAAVWERAIDAGRRSKDGARMLVQQRALLER
jgi:hypothetical protein